jgi:hypothetical protein
MAVDLFCYAVAPTSDVEIMLTSLSENNQEIFHHKFLISKIREMNSVHKEISSEYGIHAQSFFMVSLNEKSAANLVLEVVSLIKNSLGEEHVLILHGNDKIM